MAKIVSEDVGDFYHHYPRVPCVVTAYAKGRDNAMVAAWHMSISFEPPLYGVAISPKRFTYQLIAESKQFGVNFLPLAKAELIAAIGGSSGQEVDKFHRFNITKDKPAKTNVPILKDAYAAYECQLVDDRNYGDHQLLVGEVIAVHMLEESFTAEGTLDLARVSPLLYIGHDLYVTTLVDSVRRFDRKVYGMR